jgi:hypothetical protein
MIYDILYIKLLCISYFKRYLVFRPSCISYIISHIGVAGVAENQLKIPVQPVQEPKAPGPVAGEDEEADGE